jgi:hypothetical protein
MWRTLGTWKTDPPWRADKYTLSVSSNAQIEFKVYAVIVGGSEADFVAFHRFISNIIGGNEADSVANYSLLSTPVGGSEADYIANYSLVSNQISGSNIQVVVNFQLICDVVGGSETDAIGTYTLIVETVGGSSIALKFETFEAVIDFACYVLNIDTGRTYQYDNYDFLGFGRFKQKFLGIKSTAIMDLETTETKDDGTDITAYFEVKTDFGIANYKRYRGIYIESNDNVTITITDSSGNIVRTLSPNEFLGLPRNLRDKSFTIKVSNKDGNSVVIRRLHSDIDILKRKGV